METGSLAGSAPSSGSGMIAAPGMGMLAHDLSRMQMYKAIKSTFCIHKSFDIQLDLEFMPSFPADPNDPFNATFKQKPPYVTAPLGYYGNSGDMHQPQAPKPRHAYAGSPKNAPTHANPYLKKRGAGTPYYPAGVTRPAGGSASYEQTYGNNTAHTVPIIDGGW